jgi:mannose-6-phosphate isomerase-like protein (cupin superfamily)
MTVSIRRIVTGHDPDGKAVVLSDSAAPNVKVRPVVGITSTLVWVTDESPADISGSADRADRQIGVSPPRNGSVFRIVDFPPGKEMSEADRKALMQQMGLSRDTGAGGTRHGLMHRTDSIDYVIVLEGEIDMVLDDSEVHMRPGDVMVQQGTNHAWVNRSNANCRIAFVLIDAVKPAVVKDAGH